MANKKGYIKLSWSGINDEYLIEYSTDGINYQFLAKTSAKEYVHANLDPNTMYYYRVWGITKGQKSKKCAQISAYPRDTIPPSPPVILETRSLAMGFQIKLQQPTDLDWAGFRIYASTVSNFTPSPSNLVADTKSTVIQITGLQGGATYYIKAVSYDTTGNTSSVVGPVSVQTLQAPDTTPPAVPTGLTLSTYLDSAVGQKVAQYPAVIKATWVANTESDLAGYQLRIRKTGETDYTVVSTKETSYVFRGLSAGTQYGVQIRAYDIWGNYSNWSTEATITTAGDTTSPPTPSNITAVGYFKTIRVKWDNVTAPDLAGYELYASQTAGFTPSPSNLVYIGLSNSFTFTADVNQTWYFKVRAFDTSGNFSNFSTEVSATTAQIQTADIAVNSIASNLIQAGAITTDHLSANCITGEKISTDAIETKHIKTDAITLQQLSIDTQLIAWGTSFEDDTDGDGIPDGWVIPSGQPTSYVQRTTEAVWQGKYSLKMFRPGNYGSAVWITYNKFIPLSAEDRPLLVWIIAKRASVPGDSMLFFTLREYDANLNLIYDSNGQPVSYSIAFDGLTSSWLDFVFQINSGSLALAPNCKYIQLALSLDGGTQNTTVYVDTILAKPAAFVPTSYGSLFTISEDTYQIINQTFNEPTSTWSSKTFTIDLVDKFIKVTRVVIQIPYVGNPITCSLGVSRIGGRGFYTDTYTIGTVPDNATKLDVTLSPPRTSFRKITITLTASSTLYSGDYIIQIYGNTWGIVF